MKKYSMLQPIKQIYSPQTHQTGSTSLSIILGALLVLGSIFALKNLLTPEPIMTCTGTDQNQDHSAIIQSRINHFMITFNHQAQLTSIDYRAHNMIEAKGAANDYCGGESIENIANQRDITRVRSFRPKFN